MKLSINESLGFIMKKSNFYKKLSEKNKLKMDALAERVSEKFDENFYIEMNTDLDFSSISPLEHFLVYGWRENRAPIPYFDMNHYKDKFSSTDANPFIIYMQKLEQLYISDRDYEVMKGKIDRNFYYEQFLKYTDYDILLNNRELCGHYHNIGWRQGFDPNPDFSTTLYLKSHTDVGDATINPYLHYLATGFLEERSIFASELVKTHLPTLQAAHKFYTEKGPLFEEANDENWKETKPLTHLMAYYLPQFHAIVENDKWWGKGFTEWRNIPRGLSRFDGHYQPRLPGELGYYDLTDVQVIKAQVKMAKEAGLSSFCYYYYTFNGDRLLEKPLDLFINNQDIDFQFSIMWANENWTRTWDGFEKDILMSQNYSFDNIEVISADIAKYMSDPRYVRIDGKPILFIYRPGAIDQSVAYLQALRDAVNMHLGEEILVYMAQGFGDENPQEFDLDGAIEFPPHKLGQDVPPINEGLKLYDTEYSGHVIGYQSFIENSLSDTPEEYHLIKAACPSWDNDARRPGYGMVVQGSSPSLYQAWLTQLANETVLTSSNKKSFMVVNAWNEWAEAAYLEPDIHYGAAYLNATSRALKAAEEQKLKLILVGHDAHLHGAQMLLLNIGRTLKKQFGVEVAFLLLGEGALFDEYQSIAETRVIASYDQNGLNDYLNFMRKKGFVGAISNTTVSNAYTAKLFKKYGFRVTGLIHELPNLIKEFGLDTYITDIVNYTDKLVFPSSLVEQGFAQFSDLNSDKTVIQPQGLYLKSKDFSLNKSSKRKIMKKYNIPANTKIVLNVGYGDLRKGIDLFLSAAKKAAQLNLNICFVWAGRLEDNIKTWILPDVESTCPRHFKWIDFTHDIHELFGIANCFFMTSREDPYPSTVLEALAFGLPLVGFKNTIGNEHLIRDYGTLVSLGDIDASLEVISKEIDTDTPQKVEKRKAVIKQDYDFSKYCFDLIGGFVSDLKKISVVVPNYNYERHLPERLSSIFEQGYPVFEVVVLDDKSSDDSVSVIRQIAAKYDRLVRLIENKKNSGSVFKQWEKGLSEIKGDFVWIAEADDIAQPSFLLRSSKMLDEDEIGFSFTDSAVINTQGDVTSPNYKFYYDTVSEGFLKEDRIFKGPDLLKDGLAVKNFILNASAVVWNVKVLTSAIKTVGDDLYSYKISGDWLLYAQIALDGYTIAYSSAPLNKHRRHETSVTQVENKKAHFDEIVSVQEFVRKKSRIWNEKEILNYRSEVKKQLGLL